MSSDESFRVNTEDMAHLATLARIRLSDEEKAALSKDLEAILGYVRQVSEVADKAPKVSARLENVFREDGKPHATGAYSEVLLAEAPAVEKNFVKVKKIISRR